MRCVKAFEKTYKRVPDGVSFCPYRVCPIGAHVDHQHGRITGFAIDKGIHIAYGIKRNGVIEVQSLQFDKRAQFHVNAVPAEKENDWADYLRGGVWALSQKYKLSVGLCCIIDGSLPIGGLSSSATVVISFLSALCAANGITLSQSELINVALKAENEYVGVSCGKLDQSCEVYSKKGHLLYLDTLDDSYEVISMNKKMKPFEIAIFFSGIERNLAGSQYNVRVDECRSAAYALKSYEGLPYGKFEQAYLRDVPKEVFEKHKDKLPISWRLRAEHYYAENDRVIKGVEAWRNGDIKEFGKLCFESGKSSIEKWQTGSEEFVELYDIMTRTDGIYGGRFSGAGFKGCCMALIDPSFKESIKEKVTEEYLKKFPQLKDRFSIHFCHGAEGVKLI